MQRAKIWLRSLQCRSVCWLFSCLWCLAPAGGGELFGASTAAGAGQKLVGLAYSTWHRGDPARKLWGTPELGVYRSNDRSVIRQHGQWLAEAGVDFVFVDWSNNINFDPERSQGNTVFAMIEEATTALFEEWKEIKGAPKICIMAGVTLNPAAVRDGRLQKKADQIYRQFLEKREFRRMYQEYDGKPLLIVYVNTPSPFQSGVPGWRDARFTVRYMTGYIAQQSALFDPVNRLSKYGFWSWEERGKQSYTMYKGKPEAMTVVAAWRDHDKGQPTPAGALGGRRNGDTLREGFSRAAEVGVRLALVVSWNEWSQGEQPSPEFSKDLEPSKEHGRFYLDLLAEQIRKFKGAPEPKPGKVVRSTKPLPKVPASSASLTAAP